MAGGSRKCGGVASIAWEGRDMNVHDGGGRESPRDLANDNPATPPLELVEIYGVTYLKHTDTDGRLHTIPLGKTGDAIAIMAAFQDRIARGEGSPDPNWPADDFSDIYP
jgi:hypothetical protein